MSGFNPPPPAGSSGSGSEPTIRQGTDGQYYQLGADGRWKLIEGMPAPVTPAKDVIPYRRVAADSIIPSAISIGPKPIAFNDTYGSAAVDSPEALQAANAAYERIANGTGDAADMITLRSLGVTPPKDPNSGSSGDGVGYANLAQRQAEFAYQQEQDRIALERQKQQDALKASIDYINGLVAMQQDAEARQKQAQAAQLDALQYAMPAGMTYAPGFSPTSAAVKYGLVDAFAPAPIAVNPNAGLAPTDLDAQIAQRLAALQGYGVQG